MTHSAQQLLLPESKLERALELACRLYPALKGRVGDNGPADLQLGLDNRQTLANLYQHWQLTCPAAGRPYWAVKTWSMLYWQPVFLTVVAVHGAQLLPSIRNIGQHAQSGTAAGFTLPDQYVLGSEPELIQHAGKELRLLCDGLFDGFSQVARLQSKLAFRLVADCLMFAVADLHRLQPTWTCDRILALSSLWLEAMGLANESALMSITLTDGSAGLGVDRKACCLHYLRCETEVCASCPRQPKAVRLERLAVALTN